MGRLDGRHVREIGMKIQAAMMSASGRELTTEQTAARLLETGLGDVCDDPTLCFAAPAGAKPPHVPGWRICSGEWGPAHLTHPDRWEGRGPNPWYDFAQLLLSWDASRPALFFEDDVWPCRNAPIRMATLEAPADAGVVVCFDLRNEWPRPGFYAAAPGKPLWGAQALMFPAHAIAGLQMLALRGPTMHGVAMRVWDTWIGYAVEELGLRVYHYAPSLVQHRGMWSLGHPHAERPIAVNYPGEDFDALGPCADPIVLGPSPAPIGLACKMHGGEIHPNGMRCANIVD
jgi:hypothetical protein